MFSKIVKPCGNGSIILISITPGSREPELLCGIDEWRGALKVKVAQPPEGGKANRELIEGFSGFFNAAVRILSGSAARQKTLYVPLPPGKVVELLGNATLKLGVGRENAREPPAGQGNGKDAGKSASKGGRRARRA